mmetsp:Transcript_10710/g.19843  ORF Transcript_10710/g.19843 Transcript_10710/m.19843 type:complete len:179 (+) Transcript_10710:44-580(+)|eukprot:CAMPEP_0184518964 /NCGR_PEP_ID=MMETSP0198_2-20121128/6369_1 /TAXON_ID=1112570 /ORGANISM="Thraustochytrium sp., Strain LLF1b" /LENGTH=178 /DNA_ID=CAMNT_0026909439 /DNA_START=69 /DNA_END=605 /DNA_ORIENTATION=-
MWVKPGLLWRSLPQGRRGLLAVDYGLSRIGLAVTDPGWTVAQPHSVINGKQPLEKIRAEMLEVCEELALGGVVVGWPLIANDDSAGRQCQLVAEFMKHLALEQPKTLWDERYTTSIADMYLEQERFMMKGKRKKIHGKTPGLTSDKSPKDALAAAVLLGGFLDHHGPDASIAARQRFV